MEKQVQTKRQIPNKYVYGCFLIAAIVFACLQDFSSAIIFGGIGLAFDPFDQAVAFQQRPVWQRVWLVVHCIFVFILLGLSLKDAIKF